MSYVGPLENLASLQNDARHVVVKGDMGNFNPIASLLAQYPPRAIINFAAEFRVDRSIHGPEKLIQTNFVGSFANGSGTNGRLGCFIALR